MQVLRYECYFKEGVTESNAESYRVRRCVLLFYLLDGSIQVSEPKIENSGLPQGEGKGAVFVRRHRVAKPAGSFIGLDDLGVGRNVTLYGRTFRLTDADAFTRDFMSSVERRDEPANEETPIDTYNAHRAALREQTARNAKYFHPRPSEDDLMRYMEAKLGASSSQLGGDKLGKFLRHDRQVLRFFLAWDDRCSIYGELRPFALHYYLQVGPRATLSWCLGARARRPRARSCARDAFWSRATAPHSPSASARLPARRPPHTRCSFPSRRTTKSRSSRSSAPTQAATHSLPFLKRASWQRTWRR